MQALGRMHLILGAVVITIGLLLVSGAKIPFLGRLPGDIRVERENFSCSFPIITSLLVSVILTLILSAVAGLLNR